MADANKIIGIETKDILKINSIEGSDIAKLGNTPVSFAQIPTGLIVFLNDTSIPANWERFTAPDDRMIVGAGSSYSIADQGGSDNAGSYSPSVSSAGNHGGTSYMKRYNVNPPSSEDRGHTNIFGLHAHSMGSLTYSPAKQNVLLIKAQTDLSQFPINTVMPSGSSLSGLTNLTNYSDKMLVSKDNLNSSIKVASALVSSGGNHYHLIGGNSTAAGTFTAADHWVHNIAGNHSGGGVGQSHITDNIKKVLLSLWTNASAMFDPNLGMIGMWESLTAPDGWVLCDGNNSSPDLRDSFIKPVNSGSENLTPAGNNTINVAGFSVNHSASHNHYGSPLGFGNYSYPAVHSNNDSFSHSHSIGAVSSIAYIPPYYALSFIMKTA